MTGKHHSPPLCTTYTTALLTIMFLFLSVISSFAQSLSIQARVNKTAISLDDYLTLQVVIEGANINSLPDPELPELPNFTITSSSQGSNFSWINGKVSISKTIHYILSPNGTGTFTIPPIKISQGDKTYQSEAITITVSQTASNNSPSSPIQPGQRPSSPQSNRQSSERDGRVAKGNIFITNTVNKEKAYVNEQIILTFSFFSCLDLWQNPSYSQSDLEGFWEEDLEEIPGRIEVIEGRPYRVKEIKKALFPMSPGTHTIGPANLSYQTGFFSRPRTLSTEPVTIEVLPLPEAGKPENFAGAVGQFSLAAHLDKSSGVQNQPLTLHVKIKGTGHIEGLQEPLFSELIGFQKYDTTISQAITRQGRIEGEKNFDLLLIPRETGDLQISPVTFSYFNPENKRYHKLSSKPINLSIEQATETVTQTTEPLSIPQGTNQEEVKPLREDLHYIKENLTGFKKNIFILENKIFWCIILFPLFGLMACYLIDRRNRKLEGDIRSARFGRAHRLAKKTLQQARSFHKKGSDKEFYMAIAKSLTEYVADKLNVQAAGLTNQYIKDGLGSLGVSEETASKIQECLESCDYARFAPGSGEAQARERVLAEAEGLIMSTEKALKGKELFSFPLFLYLGLMIWLSIFRPFSLPVAFGQSAHLDKSFKLGNGFYQKGDFNRAIEEYLTISGQGIKDPNLFYNLGNAYFKRGDLGKSILFFERARRLLSRDKDIQKNLAFVRGHLKDKVSEEDNVLLLLWQRISFYLTINELTILVTALYMALIFCLGLIILKKEGFLRNLVYRAMLFFLIPFLLSGGLWLYRIYHLKVIHQGVIISKTIQVKSGPEKKLATLFSLHEGTTFTILQQRGDWFQFTLKNGLSGWVENKDIEEI